MKLLKKLFILAIVTVSMSSCYSYKSVVGTGPQGAAETTAWNHYVLYGLAPVGVSDSKALAAGAENYKVHTRQTFVNGLVSGMTFGIYTPTTTTVTK